MRMPTRSERVHAAVIGLRRGWFPSMRIACIALDVSRAEIVAAWDQP